MERQAKKPAAQRLLLACWYLKLWNESQTKIVSGQLALKVGACLRSTLSSGQPGCHCLYSALAAIRKQQRASEKLELTPHLACQAVRARIQ